MTPQLLALQAWHWGFENRYVPQQKFQGHSGKCVCPGVVCLIRLFFFCFFLKIFADSHLSMCVLCPNTFNSSRGLTRSFSFSIKFCPLPTCRFSHLHTLTPSHSQTRICPNLLTLISAVRNSQIFSPAVLHFFFILQTSRPLNLRSSLFHTLSSAASRQKNTPTGTTFPVLLLGKNRTTGAENPVPIDSKGQCCFNPKTDLQEKRHFVQGGEKLVRVELTMRLQRGEETVAQCCFLKPKTDPQEEK